MVLKVCSLDWQCHVPWELAKKANSQLSTPDPLNQKLWGWASNLF